MKMSSRDDETLPISGFTEEFSADVTVDEDFIPTSQPQSCHSSKHNKIEESSLLQDIEEVITQVNFIDDTLPSEALIQQTQDKTVDFIPDTETKKRNLYYCGTIGCKKKLPISGTEDLFGSEWEKQKVPEICTLDLETDPVLCDSTVKLNPPNLKMSESSITEILVNDSADTVELGETPIVRKFEHCESYGSDRCEETQVLDSSVLLLDQPSTSGLNAVKSQSSFIIETLDNESQLENKKDVQVSINQEQETDKLNEDTPIKEESGNTQDAENHSPSEILTRKIDIKLTVSCLVTINTATKSVIRKAILKVYEKPKPKTPPLQHEIPTDDASDKSKRCSTSSSGSVYSDKTSLPFALSKRIPSVLDQTCASDSSEESLSKLMNSDKRSSERASWLNESLLPLKMDEIIKGMIDNQDIMNRPTSQRAKKSKGSLRRNDLEDISEKSSPSHALKSESYTSQRGRDLSDNSDAAKDNFETSTPEESKPQEESVHNDSDVLENLQEEETDPDGEKPQEADIQLCDGLRVLARWTDKKYYSGIISEPSKNDKWDVLFDDGTVKAIKKDFIMPAAWLKANSLVFALVDDSYESGQVIEIVKGENPTYVVQLDSGKERLTVELSDISLSDDMATILRENYRPIIIESPQRKADINCENVLSGKRLREYKTPLKYLQASRIESSGSKKKPTSKTKDSEKMKETPKKKKTERKGILKADDVVEDKITSETDETPVRNNAKEGRGKTKPRSLTYELDERQKKKQKLWLGADGSPIPGPSGVKHKKKKKSEAGEMEISSDKTESETPQRSEKSKRKRKAVESRKEETPKKSVTETEIRTTRGRKK